MRLRMGLLSRFFTIPFHWDEMRGLDADYLAVLPSVLVSESGGSGPVNSTSMRQPFYAFQDRRTPGETDPEWLHSRMQRCPPGLSWVVIVS